MNNFSFAASQQFVAQIMGKKTINLNAADFHSLREKYPRVVMDLGTGDGKHILRWAKEHPQDLCIGIDSNSDALSKTSAKAGLAANRGGVPNCIFVRSAAQSVPQFLGPIDEIHILMPWGSLLRDILSCSPEEDQLMVTLASLAHPGTELIVTLNLHAWRPRVPEVGDTLEPDLAYIEGELATWYRNHGFCIHTTKYMQVESMQDFSTSWTKRIAASKTQLAVLYFQAIYTTDPSSYIS